MTRRSPVDVIGLTPTAQVVIPTLNLDGPPRMALTEQLAARLEAEEDLEDGWAGTLLVEPLTALAGGILGGAIVTVVAWRLTWRELERRHALALSRRLRRNLAGRP